MRSLTLQDLGRFYLVACGNKDGSYLVESEILPRGKDLSEADALELLAQNDDAEAIYEVCEGKFKDVSWLMAEAWMKKLADSFDPNRDEWPAFIQRHLSPLTLEEVEADILAEISHHQAHVRSFSVPA